MSREQSAQEPGLPEEFFAEVFPDMMVCVALPVDTPEMVRGRAAGIGMAEVFLENGESFQATYIIEKTSHVTALEEIHYHESIGLLPIGSHEEAIDSIFNGEFDDQWGKYLDRD